MDAGRISTVAKQHDNRRDDVDRSEVERPALRNAPNTGSGVFGVSDLGHKRSHHEAVESTHQLLSVAHLGQHLLVLGIIVPCQASFVSFVTPSRTSTRTAAADGFQVHR